ncbi:MAG TPA: polysaccharide deacetylase family protein [Verrucomicrobiae bacterium]|nr:polysaccharide deacetylase family protein [Verrucomicrobiae bacterium]
MKILVRVGLEQVVLFLFLAIGVCTAQKVAVTFDDLPLNGDLPPGVTYVDIARDALAVLQKYHLPPTYGFVNAKRLEGNPAAAEGLKLWAASEPIGNHTYSHFDLNANPVAAFEREMAEDEPALELAAAKDMNWRWLRYPYLHEGDTVEKREAVRAYLEAHGYRVAEVTLEWGDYFWNSAYARCAAKNDAQSIEWLKTAYLQNETESIELSRQLSQLVFGREINHVLLLHLGSFSSTILPDAFDLLKKKGFQFVTLEEAESDSAYAGDPAEGALGGGTLLDEWMNQKKLKYPEMAPRPYKEVQEICK